METNILIAGCNGRIYKKASSADAPVISILTYPMEDYEGDRIRPDGGDWSAYPKHPYVNWTHGCPIGTGVVNHRVLRNGDKTAVVAVGTTTFFKSAADVHGIDLRRRNPETNRFWNKQQPYSIDEVLEISHQAEKLIRNDIATGTSIEFESDEDREGLDWWELNTKSLINDRKSRHFESWRGLGYAHARRPVNPGCLTLASLPENEAAVLEKAIIISQTGKLPGGEKLNPVILKAFDDLKTFRSPTVAVQVSTGRPTELLPAPPSPAEPTLEETTPAVETSVTVKAVEETTSMDLGECPSQTCKVLLWAAQALTDVAAETERLGAASDNKSARRFVKKKAQMLREEAGDLKARAEKIKATFDDDEDDDDIEDYEPTVEEKAFTTDATGAIILKSFDWKPQRMTLKNLEPAPVTEPAVGATTAPSPLPPENKAMNRRLNKSLKALTALLDAALANGKI